MLPETSIVYHKYSCFLYILSDERLTLFSIKENGLDYDTFFKLYNEVISFHWEIKLLYRNFKKRRLQIINKFNYGTYYILLSPHFCHDLVTVIIEFLM